LTTSAVAFFMANTATIPRTSEMHERTISMRTAAETQLLPAFLLPEAAQSLDEKNDAAKRIRKTRTGCP